MKNEENQGQSRIVEDIAAHLPPNARASFISSAQQLMASSLAVTRTLTAFLAGCTWAIVHREFPTAPKTRVLEESNISKHLANVITQRREKPPHDPLYLELVTRLKVAVDVEVIPQIKHLISKMEMRATRKPLSAIAYGIFPFVVVTMACGALVYLRTNETKILRAVVANPDGYAAYANYSMQAINAGKETASTLLSVAALLNTGEPSRMAMRDGNLVIMLPRSSTKIEQMDQEFRITITGGLSRVLKQMTHEDAESYRQEADRQIGK
jgi:hypothetical protein